jgi:quercetin dioxygenase-like cupin family protein
MKVSRLDQMKRGWFIGDFTPTLHQTRDVEVAVMCYQAGDAEKKHFHKIAIEFTVVTQGEVEMNGRRYVAGDIIVMEPGEATDFRAVTDAMTTVVKIPGAVNDKYLVEPEPEK